MSLKRSSWWRSRDWLMYMHHRKHLSLKEIAERAGVSERSIRNAMNSMGIKIVKW